LVVGAVLLFVFVSLGTGLVVALIGCVPPAVLALGVTGTLIKLLFPLLIGPGLIHVITELVLVQAQPLLLNDGGDVIPLGNVMIVVIGPVVGPVPILATVTGNVPAWPATRAGLGVPIVVVRSGTPATAVVVVSAVAALLLVLVSPTICAVLALKVGVVPTIEAFGVIGTLNVMLKLVAKPTAEVQATVWPVVIQFQPLFENDAGAETPIGNDMVVKIGPGASPVPMLATVTGKLLATPATNTGLGCPSAVVMSGIPFTRAVVSGVAALLPVFTSLISGFVVALIV
jgi:hypothetical protein